MPHAPKLEGTSISGEKDTCTFFHAFFGMDGTAGSYFVLGTETTNGDCPVAILW